MWEKAKEVARSWHPLFWFSLGVFIPSFWLTGTPEVFFTLLSLLCVAGSFYFDFVKKYLSKGDNNGN